MEYENVKITGVDTKFNKLQKFIRWNSLLK